MFRNKLMGLMPDMGKLQTMFDERFGELIDHLVQINNTLQLILEELRGRPDAPAQ